jgi:hypothetical protein
MPHRSRAEWALQAGSLGDDESLIREYLQYWSNDLMQLLQSDPAIASAACEYARAWAGAELSDRVQKAASAPNGEDTDYDVLIAVAAAVGRSRHRKARAKLSR